LGCIVNPMFDQHTSIHRAASVPLIVNQTKLAIVAVMQELDRPVSSSEIQEIWAERKDLKIFEYHLSTLVKAKVVEVAYGPELHFLPCERAASWRTIF
jgi:hypothetical protein